MRFVGGIRDVDVDAPVAGDAGVGVFGAFSQIVFGEDDVAQ